MGQYYIRRYIYKPSRHRDAKSIIALSRMDSDLEAFSHKPPDVASRHYSIE